ncbi:MAG: RagB/SusD family nutrient uptake outer membrane protein [Prevotella sp.]|nr:RagB/SusD family nutrient uptake outer membrane protein [Prevotella sp.]MDD6591986.1 RagB/SusD family nutrient uptake outer membrane protein [Prevotella sp.]MDD6672181.1 RagB/SusD family nutrient uptake outer membrane protein [Prevotella sp.]MDY5851039.1 RagB/SusD family nutrient uptake outer membrane protein [Prevotella sp.]
MKLKNNIIIGVTGMMALGLGSCSDFLEIEPLNDIVLDKFWNEENDVENIVAGCYSGMQNRILIERMIVWGELRSDHLIGGTGVQDNINIQNILKENITANNVYTSWGEFYDIINRCNTVLHYSPLVAERDPNYTETELMATRAEVSAIRDLCYFYLIRTFRDVPYSTQPFLDELQQMAMPATKFDAVLDSLITDLENVKSYAVKTYPVSKTNYQCGRITQDAIHAMLAEMYLWKKDYANSVKYADMVIDAKTQRFQNEIDNAGGNSSSYKMFEGYPLIYDSYTTGNLYGNAYGTIFGSGASRESILELIFADDNTRLANHGLSFLYGNQKTSPGIVKPADFITTDVSDASYKVFCDKYDTRNYENLYKMSASQYGVAKYVCKSGMVSISSTEITSSASPSYPEEYCHANWILYRLTDVMLLKAEALVQMVDGDAKTEANDSLLRAAYDIVSVINKRSNCATTYMPITYANYSTKSQMENLVFEERARELMFEGKRWYDLVRRSLRDGNTSYLVQQVTRKGSDNASVVQAKLAKMDAIFWPYNLDELKVNPYLVQNPAFGSGDDNSYQNTTK